MRLSPADARVVAAQLELDYESVPICLACLTLVTFPLDLGNERKARHEAVALAPHFWEEGLEGPIRLALEQALELGIDRAVEAMGELNRLGARSEVVTAVVLRLATARVDELRARR